MPGLLQTPEYPSDVAELTLTQPQEISRHLEAFERLATVAAYGSAARRIVMRALEEHEPKD